MYALVIFFAVSYGGGNPASGLSGPGVSTITGYQNKAACKTALDSLKNQIVDAGLKSRTFLYCIPGPG